MPTADQYVRDNEGYLVAPETWDKDFACLLAKEEGLELNEDYWSILYFMREYWRDHRIAPDVRHVLKYLVDDKDIDKKGAKQHLFKLFPYGYVKQACKIAGMQRPRVWSTG